MNRREFLQHSVRLTVGATCLGSAAASGQPERRREGTPATGPLRVHPENPRYFTDGSGTAIYLAGWNVWSNLQDGYGSGWEHGWGNRFGYDAYLDDLVSNNLNYIRLWLYETAKVAFPGGKYKGSSPDVPVPNPWQRTGPGKAADGGLKFDLTKHNQAYFDRLRSRVAAAGRRGIYVSVMLFEGWSIRSGAGHQAFPYHPFNAANNTGEIDGDSNGDGEGEDVHTLRVPAITNLQEAYVRKVIDTVNDLDNVLYEIANESQGSAEWQYHMIRFIKAYEARKAKQHPVQMSGGGAITSSHLRASPADAIGPTQWRGTNPPAADGKHVVIADTDHLGWDEFRNDAAKGRSFAWNNFTRGNNPSVIIVIPDRAGWDEARRALGDTRTYATKMNLAAMTPHNDLASTKYCLANLGAEYLVYLPKGGQATVDLSAAKATFAVEWFDPSTGKTTESRTVPGGARRNFTAPFAGDAVLYLRRSSR